MGIPVSPLIAKVRFALPCVRKFCGVVAFQQLRADQGHPGHYTLHSNQAFHQLGRKPPGSHEVSAEISFKTHTASDLFCWEGEVFLPRFCSLGVLVPHGYQGLLHVPEQACRTTDEILYELLISAPDFIQIYWEPPESYLYHLCKAFCTFCSFKIPIEVTFMINLSRILFFLMVFNFECHCYRLISGKINIIINAPKGNIISPLIFFWILIRGFKLILYSEILAVNYIKYII